MKKLDADFLEERDHALKAVVDTYAILVRQAAEYDRLVDGVAERISIQAVAVNEAITDYNEAVETLHGMYHSVSEYVRSYAERNQSAWTRVSKDKLFEAYLEWADALESVSVAPVLDEIEVPEMETIDLEEDEIDPAAIVFPPDTVEEN